MENNFACNLMSGLSQFPFISIIVPVYNTEQYLERCFNSLQLQTLDNIEIVIIDDGSTDGSGVRCPI